MSSSPGYSNVFRLIATPELHASGAIISTVASAGAVITGLDVVDPWHHSVVLDLSCTTLDSGHVVVVRKILTQLKGCWVEKDSDSTFLIHLG
ncbi:MAG: NAD-dependent malic enzyme, partial [Actinomycetota bacterium]|nr:NAD-dependent malic enzyme [Actinomycetota bacterium]